MNETFLYGTPLLALMARGFIMLKFPLLTSQVPSESELDREGNRSIILPLAGFSFSALLALAVLEASATLPDTLVLRTPVLLLLFSFLGFYSSLNLQSYKARRWQDQLATGLKEMAAGYLLLSVISIVEFSDATADFKQFVSYLATGVWIIDLLIRFTIDYNFYRDTEKI